MTKARSIAQLLSKRFMAEGVLAAASNQRIGSLDDGFQLAVANGQEAVWESTELFSQLSVMSVGVREGQHDLKPGESSKPEVVIIAAGRPSEKFKRSLPKQLDGVIISVVASTQIAINAEQAIGDTKSASFYTRNDRIACGGSCSTATGSPGTFGALVRREADQSMHVLSCNHVLAGCNMIAVGMPILAPAPADSRPNGDLPTSIARLAYAVPLRFGDPGITPACEEDAAIGQVLNPDLVSSWQGDRQGYDTPLLVVDPEDGLQVKKFGRSTGLTYGKIYANVFDPDLIQCSQPSKNFKSPAWFQNYAHVLADRPPFAMPGDSGSLVVTRDGTAAVGLLFSSNNSGELGQIIPIRHILSVLNVALISGHGT